MGKSVVKIDAEKVAKLMAIKGMSQQELFSRGLSQGTYSAAIRRGYARPITVNKIAVALGAEPEEIIAG